MSYKLATYAMDPKKSRGRLYKDYKLGHRNEFERDLNRITSSASFRRLEHKAQVFVTGESDHYRTRLTHSLEVAQIGRTIARSLNLCTELTEVLCLAHDIGHPPFAHKGERSLNIELKNYGGFNHNVHALKLLTELEKKYIGFDGLNLTWETLEGLVKHNGPLLGPYKSDTKYPLDYIIAYNSKHDLELDKFPSLEAQAAAIADDIAYNSHDIDDALNAKLFSIDDMYKENIACDIIDEVRNIAGPKVETRRIIHEVIRRITSYLIDDIISHSKNNIKNLGIKTFEDVQNAECYIIKFSKNGEDFLNNIRAFLIKYLLKSEKVQEMARKSEAIISDLYKHYINHPRALPVKWYNRITVDQSNLHLIVSDYIAGMTDRFANETHACLMNEY